MKQIIVIKMGEPKPKLSLSWFTDKDRIIWLKLKSTSQVVVNALKQHTLFDSNLIKVQKVCNCGLTAIQETYPKTEFDKLNLEY